MKFSMNDFIELDLNALLKVNGGSGSCSRGSGGGCSGGGSPSGGSPSSGGGSSSGGGGCSSSYGGCSTTSNTKPRQKSSDTLPIAGISGGNCNSANRTTDNEQNPALPTQNADRDSTDELAKTANGISFPIGIEHSNDFVVTGDFGYRDPIQTENGSTSMFHSGIDIAAPQGTRINAVGEGVITTVGYNDSLGNYVVVSHPSGTSTRYAHCETVTVSEGMNVSAGQKIATIGSTGMSTGPHLHFSYDGNGDGQYNDPKYDNPGKVLNW